MDTGITIEDRVQVHNPAPMATGTVLDIQGKWAWIEWEDDSRSWALLALLRPTDDAR